MRPMIRPSRRLGQNFLTDRSLARKIVESLCLKEHDWVVEIGPGKGILTEELLRSPAKKVVAVEIDSRLADGVAERFGTDPRLEVVTGDFLKYPVRQGVPDGEKVRIIGNIPYRITSAILFKIMDDRDMIRDATVMLQKEVADRIASHPGVKIYGVPSVVFQLVGDVQKVLKVSRFAFSPIPDVDSSVVRLSLRHPIPYSPEEIEFFMRVVKTAFQQRRKMLKNSLKTLLPEGGLPREAGIDLSRRPEQIDPGQWFRLSKILRPESGIRSDGDDPVALDPYNGVDC
jgi:16S rRNA (adenine1518-N6/adenine1519-N6)-dimethyltransferase